MSSPPPSALRRLVARAWRARIRALPLSAFERDFRIAEPFTMLGVARLKSLHESVGDVEQRGIPGDVVECGVARGGSALVMALALARAPAPRTLWLFDTFEGLPSPSPEGDPDYDVAKELTGAFRGEEADVRALLAERAPRQDVRLIRGRFEDTLRQPPVEHVALLHLDGDWYESIKACLHALWDRCSPGAIVQIDDYFAWQGCRRAVDEFLAGRAGVAVQRVDASAIRLVKPD